MQRRRIPVLDSFFDRMNLLLWPKFKSIFVANLDSIRKANVAKMPVNDWRPMDVSRRYAEFVSSCLSLQGDVEGLGMAGGGEDMLTNDLKTLTSEMMNLLNRLSNRQRGYVSVIVA